MARGPRRIVFFTAEDNSRAKNAVKAPKSEEKSLKATISPAGRLIFAEGTAQAMGVEPGTSFRVGKDNGKAGLKALFIIPTDTEGSDTFAFTKVGATYGMNLGGIFRNQQVDFKANRYTFTVKPYQADGATGFELKLADSAPRTQRGGDEE